jgi:hypothetical protein
MDWQAKLEPIEAIAHMNSDGAAAAAAPASASQPQQQQRAAQGPRAPSVFAEDKLFRNKSFKTTFDKQPQDLAKADVKDDINAFSDYVERLASTEPQELLARVADRIHKTIGVSSVPKSGDDIRMAYYSWFKKQLGESFMKKEKLLALKPIVSEKAKQILPAFNIKNVTSASNKSDI